MKLISDTFNDKLPFKTVVALGSFDGLHKGHLSLINKCILEAKNLNAKSMIYTFKNHPLSTINKEMVPKLLITNEDKIKLIRSLKVDYLNLVPFTKEFMKITPEVFLEKMVSYYNVAAIVVGYNYRFGYKNLGDLDLLEKLSIKYGYKLFVIEKVVENGETVSSSKIRHLIEEGYISEARRLLTRPYALKGKIIRGRQIGRTMNFPTINLNYNKKYVLPKGGVYYTNVEFNNKLYRGISNIGYNPTVKGKKLSIETHILNFNEDIYDKQVKIYFIDRIRDEKKFDSIEDLKNQLEFDKKYAIKQKLL